MRDCPLVEFFNIGVAFMNTAFGFHEAGRGDGLIRGNLLVGHHRTRAGKRDGQRLAWHKGIAAFFATGQTRCHISTQARAAGKQLQISAGFGKHRKLRVIDTIHYRVTIAIAAQFSEALAYPRRPLRDIRASHQTGLAATLRVHQADEARIRHRRNRVVAHA